MVCIHLAAVKTALPTAAFQSSSLLVNAVMTYLYSVAGEMTV